MGTTSTPRTTSRTRHRSPRSSMAALCRLSTQSSRHTWTEPRTRVPRRRRATRSGLARRPLTRAARRCCQPLVLHRTSSPRGQRRRTRQHARPLSLLPAHRAAHPSFSGSDRTAARCGALRAHLSVEYVRARGTAVLRGSVFHEGCLSSLVVARDTWRGACCDSRVCAHATWPEHPRAAHSDRSPGCAHDARAGDATCDPRTGQPCCADGSGASRRPCAFRGSLRGLSRQ